VFDDAGAALLIGNHPHLITEHNALRVCPSLHQRDGKAMLTRIGTDLRHPQLDIMI
jgi:hypothetical protein